MRPWRTESMAELGDAASVCERLSLDETNKVLIVAEKVE
jgi:hypothetical protein